MTDKERVHCEGAERVTEYRWGRASGGEIPADAVAKGHGWEYDTKGGERERVPLWLARSLPDERGSVRVCSVRPGYGAALCGELSCRIGEYEVLLDEGTWIWAGGDKWGVPMLPANAVVCGRSFGKPTYAALEIADFAAPQIPRALVLDQDSRCRVLVDPSLPAYPMVRQPHDQGEEQSEFQQSTPVGPRAVVLALDCRQEVVVIANAGDAELDLSGWKLHDAGSRNGYVFPVGTKVAASALVRVRSGPGAEKPTAGELAWKTASVWKGKGDTAYLVDPVGTLVSSVKR
jgi:hypothetical protein